ncbi:MAG TPA: riboflavin synthase [Usitatibacter sp.]|nr:riboflavin synthase [Usitatibacter sp.]
MFAGIVTHVGRIESAAPMGDGKRLRVGVKDFGMDEVRIGDSIAIQGVCHTVVARHAQAFEVDTSRATLDVTAGLEAGREVNLEKSLRLADRIDGHLVYGHVDGVGRVLAFDDLGGSSRLSVEVPPAIARYIAKKGSITVDGVSLTVNAVDGSSFEVNIIPHTKAATTLRNLAPGTRVNLEVDMLARYVERLLGR